MPNAYWDDAYRLFSAALDADAAGRAGLLEAASADAPRLVEQVRALLAAHDASADFLDPSPPRDHASAAAQDSLEPGAVVGPWRLVDRLGGGGMGEVFRAERADGAFAQRVAVKVMRTSWLDREAGRRFRIEREILASLSHPHIVSLVDGGTLPSGQAWLAMELVEGQPITAYADGRRLPLVDRLRLFRQVCSAVHYAHQHGVVHRDLKPENLLITGDGVPKILDFGVAKLFERDLGASATMTAPLGVPLTPNYASPEQLRGLTVTTVSDVYALGVMLYELVSAARPYETTGKPLDEVLSIVTSREPVRPSAAIDARGRIAGRLWPRRGDLDAIVLKALAKAPERRYASPAELSADLGRYLDGQPVVAREPSLSYVAARLLRRHALVVGTAAVALLALVGGLAAAVWQARIAEAARTRAEQQRERADARFRDARALANTLIFTVHDAVEPLAGSTPVRRTIVQSALTYLERLSRDATHDARLQLELAGAYARIGRVQGDPQRPNLGDRQGAEASLRRALALAEPLTRHADRAVRSDALDAVAQTEALLSNVLKAVGRTADAVAAARRAVAARLTVAEHQSDAGARRALATAYFSLALALQGLPEEEAAWKQSQTIFEQLLAGGPDDPGRLRDVALVAKYLASLYEQTGRLAEARASTARALELDERRLARAPEDRQARFDVAIDLASQAALLNTAGQYPEADALLRRSLALRRTLVEADPQDVLARLKVAAVLWRLGQNALEAGRPQEARRAAREALETIARSGAAAGDVPTDLERAAALTVAGAAAIALADRSRGCADVLRGDALVRDLAERGTRVKWDVLSDLLPASRAICTR